MTETRKRKFRRWADKGVPKSAPIAEKRAFGAFVTNRRRGIAKRLGAKTAGKAHKYETKRTRGKWMEIDIDRPLTDLESESFRRDVAALCWEFHKRHRGQLGFIRLLIRAAENPYSAYPFNGDSGGTADHWFGGSAFSTKQSAYDSVADLAERLASDVLPYDSGDGRIIKIHTFTVRNKRGMARTSRRNSR